MATEEIRQRLKMVVCVSTSQKEEVGKDGTAKKANDNMHSECGWRVNMMS